MIDQIVSEMLRNYSAESDVDRKNALKEVGQEFILMGLGQTDFFEKAAFYGGTALRIFYGLNRFSEDMDFTLLKPTPGFRLEDYIQAAAGALRSFAPEAVVEMKAKSQTTSVESAFARCNAQSCLERFYGEGMGKNTPKNENLKIKIEIDTQPRPYAEFERKTKALPFCAPFKVTLYDESSLFASKVHAVLDRKRQKNLKGRDLYDYIFYIERNTKINLKHLYASLEASAFIPAGTPCTLENVRKMLCDKFISLNYDLEKRDVFPFIRDSGVLDCWGAKFFQEMTERLQAN